MKKNTGNHSEDIKPDLKHDNMEYSAATDGDDILDMDTETEEEIEGEDISEDELDVLEDDNVDEQAAALNSVEVDRKADDDLIFDEDDNDEEYEDDIEEELPRK